MRTAFPLAALLLSGCSSPYWTCNGEQTLCVNGLPVFMDPALASSLGTPEIGERIASEVTASLSYWDLPASALGGWRVSYVRHQFECEGVPATGCWEPDERTVTLTVDAPECIELAPLPHELGHFVESGGHTDPRWCGGFEPVLEAAHAQPACRYLTAPAWQVFGCWDYIDTPRP